MKETGSLFRESEAGVAYADVIVDLPSSRFDRPFTYAVPAELGGQARVGSLVLVPLSGGLRTGFIVSLSAERPARQVKPLEDILDEEPFFGEELAALCAWIADYYLAPLAKVFRLVIPPGRARKLERSVELVLPAGEALNLLPPGVPARRVVELLADRSRTVGQLTRALGKDAGSHLAGLRKAGVIAIHSRLTEPQTRRASTTLAALTPAGADELAQPEASCSLKRAPLQAAALRALAGGEMPLAQVKADTGAGRAVLAALASKGLVELREIESFRDPFSHLDCAPQPGPVLNREQASAFDSISRALAAEAPQVFLLHGITGSGKTEVYLSAIEQALQLGKSSITLVPEIALTPQMVSRFKARLGDTVAVLHSHLGIGERYDQWRRIARGDCRVVIGARSAIFAPAQGLGLIIVDEEHETSYKEHSPPRYHAREVAMQRGRANRAAVVLGSATPSLESLHFAQTNEYRLLSLPRRIDDRPLPRVSVVDLRESDGKSGRNLLSPAMVKALAGIYKSGDQAILFLNRRGFANFLQCHKCGYIFRCPSCEVSLCYHLDRKLLLCHHCGLAMTSPFLCGDCGNSEFLYLGAGTERVEQELKRVLPPLRCIRMDSDTTRRKNAHWEMLDRFKAGEAQVLLGTQMIAKGLDIPSVTLVGIINADTSLGLPDFRAGERTFQLLTQVSGRAGRGARPGRVIIQTFNPDHYSIVPVVQGRQDSFYTQELQFRRDAGYPPFERLVNLVFSSASEEAAREAAAEMQRRLAAALPEGCRLLGPAPAPMARLKGRSRYHLIIKTPALEGAVASLRATLPGFENWRSSYCSQHKLPADALSLAVDVDPATLL